MDFRKFPFLKFLVFASFMLWAIFDYVVGVTTFMACLDRGVSPKDFRISNGASIVFIEDVSMILRGAESYICKSHSVVTITSSRNETCFGVNFKKEFLKVQSGCTKW